MKVAGGGRGGAFYLYEPSLAEGSDWWRQRRPAEAAASRWSSVESLGPRSTPERNVLMQDWSEID